MIPYFIARWGGSYAQEIHYRTLDVVLVKIKVIVDIIMTFTREEEEEEEEYVSLDELCSRPKEEH